MNQIQTLSAREMRNAFYRGDSTYDGIFYVAVKTTNIFCRPTCKVRKPLEKNIEFFPSAKDALFAGYRACKRCKPLEPAGTQPDWAKELIDMVDKSDDKRINDGTLRKMGIDPARARRYFMKTYNMTFHAYQRSRRLSTALTRIREGSKLDEVILSNGYESHSGFRDAFGKVFGKPPGKSKSSDCVVTSLVESPLGPLILGATEKGLCLCEFTDRRMLEFQMKTLHKRFDAAIVPGTNKFIEQAKDELKEYFAGKLKKFKVKLIYPGTEFQQNVWNELQKIPYGTTIAYADLAKSVGIPGAVRAVGTANGMNRIGIIIPCHRVVNKSGKLGGYGGGVWRKKWLLDLEMRSGK
ncbi:MAG TPA: methylated-DNA--[protein]-cysteine S-methyltransferase [Ignavibacteria bacterium]|nr:methylated-DNA--[protein]-cysteine S-methyltransferase [Ignavibacteria bacterium]